MMGRGIHVFMAAALLALGGAAAGQAPAPDLLVSLSGDDALPGQLVRDEDLVHHAPGQIGWVAWPSETLSLLAGDGGAPLHPVFNDVDALHDAGGGGTAAEGLYLSFTTDEAGFLDGDVLRLGPGGMHVAHPEAQFVAWTGASDGNVDVDALQIDADGTLWFSFADNENSSLLSGDQAGLIKDGDILYVAPGASLAVMAYTESQVDGLVSAALGLSTTTTDTLGLSRDPRDGALLFSVQSPTAHDASVFTVANGGGLLAGHVESEFGFTGAPELDAFTVAHARFPALTTSSGVPGAGETLTLRIDGAQGSVVHVVLASLALGPSGAPPMTGWGGLVLAPDALFWLMWSSAMQFAVLTDVSGSGELSVQVPAAVLALDVVCQAVAPGFGPDASNPILIELAQ